MNAIDADVRDTAHRFGVDAGLIQAVVTAEGNILKAVQCSVPSCQTRAQALEILCRSAVHALSDYVQGQHAAEYVSFWGTRWAPVGAANDPHGLNTNWVPNVLRLWKASGA